MKTNVTVISLMMFYDNSNTVVFRVLESVVYTIIDDLKSLDYLPFSSVSYPNKTGNLEKKFNDLSGMGIP